MIYFWLWKLETPEVIAISETKLHDENIQNISIPGYVSLNTNSPARAGGVGLYISQELTLIRRRDLEITGGGIESCWAEIMRKKENDIIARETAHPAIKTHYYMALSHKDWELPNSRIWLAKTDIDRGLDFPI